MHPRDWNPFATCKPRLANSGSTQAPTHAKRSWIPPCSEPLMPSKLNQLSYFESPINPMETTFFWVKPPCYHVPMLFLCFSYVFPMVFLGEITLLAGSNPTSRFRDPCGHGQNPTLSPQNWCAFGVDLTRRHGSFGIMGSGGEQPNDPMVIYYKSRFGC